MSWPYTFQQLLAKDKSVSVDQKNLQLLATEIFKSRTRVSHFVERPYDLRSNYTIERKQDPTVYHGLDSLSSLAPNFLSSSTKLNKKFYVSQGFFKKINTWTTDHCPCRIRQKHAGRVGFIFALSVFSSFYLTIWTSCFLAVLHLVIFLSKSVNFYFIQLFEIFNFI